MRATTVRLGLSLMVAAAFWVSPVQAQGQVAVVPAVPYEPAHHAYEPPAFARPLQSAPGSHLPQRILNKHGMCCETNAFYPACGNLRYEWNFIFGSCRAFFPESCPPSQHHRRRN